MFNPEGFDRFFQSAVPLNSCFWNSNPRAKVLGRGLENETYQNLLDYRSIQIDYRQTFCLGRINFSITDTESCCQKHFITETDLWDYQQKISPYRYAFTLESA